MNTCPVLPLRLAAIPSLSSGWLRRWRCPHARPPQDQRCPLRLKYTVWGVDTAVSLRLRAWAAWVC